MENPAKLSAEVVRLFPSGVIAAEVTVPVDRALLTTDELQFIAHCADKRIQDFAAGRACARLALGGLGIAGFSLLAGAQREPQWPPSVVGSITHTQGYAAAVVARDRDVRGLGLDSEVVESVHEDLWPQICTSREIERLTGLAPPEQCRQAALLFAAKEAFYKFQFPLTRQWVGFEDVVIESRDWQAATGALRVIPQKALPLDDGTVAALQCRFQFRGPWVLAGVAWV